MSPAFNLYGCTLIVLAEWKPPVYDNTKGVVLVTASTRRNSPNEYMVISSSSWSLEVMKILNG
ncbi:hypothetical protein BVRB_1g020960 [Beta vulgaris subsp. vulgaris]|nr:hypothetical protein BVRB_1g020960 [Beta vulgaris subsp. vulgaris]